jgi:hypothetical protein
MKTWRYIVCLVLIVSLQLSYSIQVYAQQCPECYNNVDPLAARWGYSDDSRQVTKFYVDETGMSPTEATTARNGTQSAADQWNNTTDSAGNLGPYKF